MAGNDLALLTHWLDKIRHDGHKIDPPHIHRTGYMICPLNHFYIHLHNIRPTSYMDHHLHSYMAGHKVVPITRIHIHRSSIHPPLHKLCCQRIFHKCENSPMC